MLYSHGMIIVLAQMLSTNAQLNRAFRGLGSRSAIPIHVLPIGIKKSSDMKSSV